MERKVGRFRINEDSRKKRLFYEELLASDEQLEVFTLFLFYSNDKITKDSEELQLKLDSYMNVQNECYIRMKEYFFYQEKLVCVFDRIGRTLLDVIESKDLVLLEESEVLQIWMRVFQGAKSLLSLCPDFLYLGLEDIRY